MATMSACHLLAQARPHDVVHSWQLSKPILVLKCPSSTINGRACLSKVGLRGPYVSWQLSKPILVLQCPSSTINGRACLSKGLGGPYVRT